MYNENLNDRASIYISQDRLCVPTNTKFIHESE